tara:strand:- start:373 stop:567 length:195 start_codon:yes stop_codon:yes gene_type:complete
VQETEFNCKNEKNLLFFEIFSKWVFFPQKEGFLTLIVIQTNWSDDFSCAITLSIAINVKENYAF